MEITVVTGDLIGQEYRSFDGKRRWELLFEDIFIVILDTGVERGNDVNLVGIGTSDLRVKWALGGDLGSPDSYDGFVNVWVKDGKLWAGCWRGTSYELDHQSGKILREVYRK